MRPSSALVCLLACALASLSGHAPRARAESVLRVVLAGDVMFGRWQGDHYRPYDRTLSESLVGRLRAADLSVVNLETGMCSARVAREHAAETALQRHRLTAPVERLAELTRAGVDVAVLANNHALDCGRGGLAYTERALARHAILALGAHSQHMGTPPSLHVRRAGFDILMLAATLHRLPVQAGERAPYRVEAGDVAFVEHLRETRARHPEAVLLVSLHWGREHAAHPAPHQRAFAHALVDAGADVVHGHGPHVLQDLERHGRGLIVYSAGNLHFDMKTPSTLVELTVARVEGKPSVVAFAPFAEP